LGFDEFGHRATQYLFSPEDSQKLSQQWISVKFLTHHSPIHQNPKCPISNIEKRKIDDANRTSQIKAIAQMPLTFI
jgi:hypothetical protein